jgi:hypothetical protein
MSDLRSGSSKNHSKATISEYALIAFFLCVALQLGIRSVHAVTPSGAANENAKHLSSAGR